MNCMLQVLVHDNCTICAIANYGIGTIIFLIVTVNLEYHIIVLIAHYFVFQTSIVSAEFDFFSFLLSFSVCVSLHESGSMWVWGWRMCSSLIFRSRLQHKSSTWTQLGTWTGTRIFDWDSHICRGGHVFTTAKLVLNNVLYHTVI